MRYRYLAYTTEKALVKGTLEADSVESAERALSFGGYQVVSLKLVTSIFNRQASTGTPKIKSKDIIMFSRQLALLYESGVDISRALELLLGQTTNTKLRKTINTLIANIREGSSLSTAMSKCPGAFPEMYYRTIAAGEQGGNLASVLRRMADYMEKSELTTKKVKGALTYPLMVFGLAIVVVSLLVIYVIPIFGNLYKSFGAKLPAIVTLLLSVSDWTVHFGIYVLIIVAAIVGGIIFYVKTPPGRLRWDGLVLKLPIVGRIALLNELARCCRTMALLINVGLALPEILTIAIQSAGNKMVVQSLTEVQKSLIRGEGISGPMSKRPVFLPLMVAMVAVGEETGKLSNTLNTVAESFELESDDKTTAATGLIQPVLTVVIAIVVGFIAMVMFSAMYSIYGQFNG